MNWRDGHGISMKLVSIGARSSFEAQRSTPNLSLGLTGQASPGMLHHRASPHPMSADPKGVSAVGLDVVVIPPPEWVS